MLAQTVSFSGVAGAEKAVQRHERALAKLAAGLEDWLTGRQGVQATRQRIQAVAQELKSPLPLPATVSARVRQAESGLLQAVTAFLAESAPDADGQRALFAKLNSFTRERALAVLGWRSTNSQRLRASTPKGSSRSRYLVWEAGWLPLWQAEVELTYRLQAHVLSGSQSGGGGFVREVLAIQARASEIAAPGELQGLQELALRRLTLLARTAEQLNRLGRGESRGALTRVRRLNKEQTELGQQLQERRLAALLQLAR